MDAIERMLTGKMEMRDFLKMLQDDCELQDAVNALVPEDAKNNPSHEIWNNYPYETMMRTNFNIMKEIRRYYGFRPTLGNALDIYSFLYRFYRFYHPDFPYMTRYRDEYNLYLDAAGETYEGPEVEELLENIIRETLSIPQKTKRVKAAREKIREAFHVTDNKRPYWVQGGEWPMGADSPMRYLRRARSKTDPEEVDFYFQDVATGEIRVVKQFY